VFSLKRVEPMNRYLLYVPIALLLIGLGPNVYADELGVEVVFSEGEIKIISGYYKRDDALSHHGKHHKGNPKKGNEGLPPGIARNLQRGKALPPGIAKQQLPAGLVAALPPAPRGCERVIVDGRVVLIEIATQVIRDVLTDIVIG
jgi:Ni/Co efflux regulator RcnB